MAEFRNYGGCGRDTVCIDTYRVLDSCRDKDCFEDVRVYLTAEGQELVDRTGTVRAKKAEIVYACIDLDNVPFNRGFYQIYLRIYTKLTCEAALGLGGIREFEGVAVVEKKVILFGGEGNVNVFRSEFTVGENGSASCSKNKGSTLPIAVLETVDPIVLGTKISEPGRPCRCSACVTVDEIPDCVFGELSGNLVDCPGSNRLLVSLGLFSVIRIERSAQYLVSGVEYSVPEKECVVPTEDDPCALFQKMAFPIAEFSSSGQTPLGTVPENEKKCPCSGNS